MRMTAGRDEVVAEPAGDPGRRRAGLRPARATPGRSCWWRPRRPSRPSRSGWVVDAGVTAIGENYVRELRAVHDAVPGARWHYIGALQTNTAHHVAALADVVETVSGERATRRLARRAAALGRTLDALIEVDFTGERRGLRPTEVVALADLVAGLEGLRPAGADDDRAARRDRRGRPAVVPAGSASCARRCGRTTQTWWT